MLNGIQKESLVLKIFIFLLPNANKYIQFLLWQFSHLHLQKTDWLDFLNIDLILLWTLLQFKPLHVFGTVLALSPE